MDEKDEEKIFEEGDTELEVPAEEYETALSIPKNVKRGYREYEKVKSFLEEIRDIVEKLKYHNVEQKRRKFWILASPESKGMKTKLQEERRAKAQEF